MGDGFIFSMHILDAMGAKRREEFWSGISGDADKPAF